MKPLEDNEARSRLREEQLKAGHSRNTRDQYLAWVVRYRKALEVQVQRVKEKWRMDSAAGVICPVDDPSLMKKLGRARFGSLPFYWLFPSRDVARGERWHATSHALTDAVNRAAREAGMTRRVTPHAFRHANATALLECGENIRAVQKHLGHEHVETTEIYTHVLGGEAVISPLDAPPRRLERLAKIVPFPSRMGALARRA